MVKFCKIVQKKCTILHKVAQKLYKFCTDTNLVKTTPDVRHGSKNKISVMLMLSTRTEKTLLSK